MSICDPATIAFMIFSSPGSIFFKLGPITVRWYGIMIVSGFLVATFFAKKMALKRNLNDYELVNCALAAFLGGVAGARLYFVILSWPYFQDHLSEILAVWQGGLSIHGGIIGALICTIFYCKKTKLPILETCDIIAASTPLAQCIGRWGNFFNSEAFGKPVPDNFPLKLFIAPENRPIYLHASKYFHPTFLYESVWNLGLFLLLYFVVADRLKKFPGLTFLLYVAGYSAGRLLIEPLRVDSISTVSVGAASVPFPIIASIVSIVVATGCIFILLIKYNKPKVQ